MWALAAIYLLSISGRVSNVDAAKMMEVSHALLESRISVPADGLFTLPGPDGLHYSYFGPLSSVWYIPFILAGQVLARLVGWFGAPVWEEFMVSFSPVPLALGVLGYLLRYWKSQGASPARASAGLWLVGIGTSLWPYAKYPGSDPLMTLALLAAVVHGLNWRRTREVWLAGVWCGLAWLARKQAEIEVPWIILFLGLRGWRLAGTRRPFTREVLVPLGWLMAGFLPLLLVQLGYNQARFGSPFREPNAAIHTLWMMPSLASALRTIIEMTVWPSRGLVAYNLLAVLMFAFAWPAWRKHAADRELPLLVLVLLGENLLFFAGTWYWNSGMVSYGSRYLLFLLPLMALGWAQVPWPLNPLRCGAFALGGIWAVWLAVMGVLVDPLPAGMRFMVLNYGQPFYRTFYPLAYAQECARVLGLNRDPLPAALAARLEMAHFAFQIPDLWWCQAFKQFQDRQALKAPAPESPERASAPR